MPLTTLTAPSAPAIDLDDLKKHLNMQGSTRFDSTLMLLISAVEGPMEHELGITLLETELKWTWKDFKRKAELPRPPLMAVEKVEYRDAEGTWQTVSDSNYEVNTDAEPGFVRFAGDYDVPETYSDEEYPWRFTYTAGFGTGAADVPPEIRLRMMNAIGSYFMKKEDMIISTASSAEVIELEKSMARLIKGYNRRTRFG